MRKVFPFKPLRKRPQVTLQGLMSPSRSSPRIKWQLQVT